jgi:hypothetical protein
MFEAWARERAALVSRASRDGTPRADGSVPKFSLADYDKFEAVVCRGTRARVTIGQFRYLALQTFSGHRASTKILSVQF